MDYFEITEMYYDRWLGTEGLFGSGSGVDFVRSAERDVVQYGYSERFDVFALARTGRIVVSYGERAVDGIDGMKEMLSDGADVDGLKAALERVYGAKATHSVKFVYKGSPEMETGARALEIGDRDAYIEFFAAAHPGADTGWLYEYWDEMAREGGFYGVFVGGGLVCAADAPGMPYMSDRVQEIGITTLPEFRRRGYALDTCVTAARGHAANGKCPLWSAAFDNAASHGLAEKVGFEKYADAIMISLE